MKKSEKTFKFLSLLVIAIFAVSCSGIESLIGIKDDKPSIPEDIVDLADGIFSLIGLVFESEADDPALDTTYPAGMTVTWVTPETVLRITLTNFSPPDDPGGIVANGSVTLSRTSTSPYTIAFTGSITITNYSYSSVALNGSAVWAAGQEPGDSEPASVTGTFTVDGKAYSIADILDAIEGGGGGGTAPTSVTPLPSSFKTHVGNFSQYFDDQVWRLGPAEASAPWFGTLNYMTFSIGDDGAHHAVYLNGTETHAGFINWYTSSGVQKLDFLDSAKTSVLYTFTVLGYSKNHLHLRALWGSETREWIFSAGMNNLTGVVTDSIASIPASGGQPYSYYPPLAGAVVELGTCDGETFTGYGAPVTADSRGFFEFPDLGGMGLPPMVGLWLRVTYNEEAQLFQVNRGFPPMQTSNYFEMIFFVVPS
jgi:hypothetical protein